MRDCILLQQASGPHAYLLNLTIGDHAIYCIRHGIDYHVVYGDVIQNRHGFWNKLALINKAVEAGYEKIVWLDSDAYIADDSVDIRQACPVDGVGATWHAQEWTEAPEILYDHWNCGVLYIGVGQNCKRFLKCWWNASDEGHCWHDQHAFNKTAIAAYKALWRADAPIVTLGHEWNSTPFFQHEKPIVAAWHGVCRELDKRLDIMQAFIAENRLKRMIEGASLEEACQKADYCMSVGNFNTGLKFFERARLLGANSVEFMMRHASALYKLRRYYEAADMWHEVLREDPTNGPVWQSLSSCYDYLGEHELNGAAIHEAYKHCPNWPPLMHNLMLWQLRAGNWREGFDGMKWQFLVRERIARCPGPEWSVDKPFPKRLFIWAEQGLGDTLMLARYLPGLGYDLSPIGCGKHEVIWEVQKPLFELMKAQCWPGVEVVEQVPEKGVPWQYDSHIGMFSLPALVDATVENTHGELYLKAPPDKVEEWSKKLTRPEKRIGFSWAGSQAHGNNHNRNIPAVMFDGLVTLPGTSWYSLQRGLEIPQAIKDDTPEVTWIGDEFVDMADTAGALMNLDVVITIDSAIAHLCGALGVKCWLLLSKSSDWRWLLDRTDTPWYDSVTLFRQSELGDWAGVMARVSEDLKGFLNDGR